MRATSLPAIPEPTANELPVANQHAESGGRVQSMAFAGHNASRAVPERSDAGRRA